MSPILAIINLAALLFGGLVLFTIGKEYRRIFLIAMILPIVLWFGVALALYPSASWGLVEIIMMLLRGSLVLGVFSGVLACYIVTKLKQR